MDARAAHLILKRRNAGRLMKAIRIVNRSEELTFCRFSPADNPPPARAPAGGRQVTAHHMRRRLDLLGMRRLRERAGSRSSRSSRYRHVTGRVPQIHCHPCAASRLPLRSTVVPLVQDE